MNGFDREEMMLEQDLEAGNISVAEYNSGMRDIQRDYADSARESAQDAYERELDRW
ncbi:MAG: hypothetical protein PHN44_00015 [Candidatus Marinimicrobia bacterium]|nr:hypothetical protein [Candidatus Neomarinimicrobiota bacterium]